MAHVLVVGAGLAGVRMCQELRSEGFTGTLTVLGAEDVAPYDRPPLSKQPGADVDLRSAMGIDVFALADEVRLGVRAEVLETSSEGALSVMADDESWHADAVVIATGAVPVLPQEWAAAGVGVLRTRLDAHHIWDRLHPRSSLLVIGGGWIGCELAATAAQRDVAVELVEAGDHLLRDIPALAAQRVLEFLVQSGVRVRTRTAVEGVARGASGLTPRLRGDDGPSHASADLLIAGLGVRSCTDWLAESGARVGDGGAVETDAWGRSSAPGVFAVGDAAIRWSPRSARHIPTGHWTEAMQAPRVVSRAALEHLATRDPAWWQRQPDCDAWDAIPYTFSEIGPMRLLVLGDAAARRVTVGTEVEHIWREAAEGWTCFTIAESRLTGICGTLPRDVVSARRAMLGAPLGQPLVDALALADPGSPPSRMFPARR